MKELSIEEKAKAFDGNYKAFTELINRLEDVKDAIKKQNYGIAMDILYKPYPEFQITTFTELKENEDEKIRKQITGFITYSKVLDETKKNWLAWLEKQGEHANFINKIQIGDKVTRNEDGVLVNLSQLKRVAKKGEKQGEQKPADKVEPKFKIGDWVIDKQGIVHQIANVIENVTYHTYGYDIVGGGYFNDNTEGVRLWTIQDAKDGDVLYTSSTASNEVFIFKELTIEGYIKCYCSYDSEDKYCEGKYHFIGKPTFMTHPATKEQRDLLFQKIHEAGYEWDADKKELKKIEQKPAWSEEDEQMFENIIEKATLKFSEWNCLKNDEINFLKSLHPQNKQEWTQDDIDMIDWLIRCCEKEHEELCNDRYGHQDIVSDLKRDCRKKWDWLESLKERVAPQSHWKPSDEQMEALKMTIDIQIEEYGFSSLNTLFEQLKSL